MIKYKRTLGEESTTIEFETMEQLLEYVRFENEPEDLAGVTANCNVDKCNNMFSLITRNRLYKYHIK